MGSVAIKNQPLKCLQSVREVPIQAYRLPTDRRKWASDCRLRMIVTLHLASRADADGGSIYPSAETVAKAIGISRRTVNYIFDDLRALGFLKDEGFSSSRYKHTRIRRLDVAAIMLAGVACVPVLQDSPTLVQDSPNGCAGLAATVVQDSPDKPIETRESCTQPTIESTAHPTAHPTGAPFGARWEGLCNQLPRELDGAVPNKQQRIEIEKQIQQHGGEVVLAAIRRWVDVREMPIAGLRSNKWGAWLRECPVHINWAVKEKKTAEEKPSLDAATEVLVQKQMREHHEFMIYEAPKPNEGDPEDYFE